jgi:hypothetical protein
LTISSQWKNIRKYPKTKKNFAYLIFVHALISSTFGAITHIFDIGEIFYRHFSVHTSLVEGSLSAGGRKRKKKRGKMLKKTFHLCLVVAVSFVAFSGERKNVKNIQISHDIEGVFC